MKIVVLTAVNTNAKYLSCVPLFIDFWRSLKSTDNSVTYVPKVLVIASEIPEELLEYSPWCQLWNVDSEISSVFASQAIRILYPAVEECDFVLTTDVDMLPLSDRMFDSSINAIRVGAQFVVCRDVLQNQQYPICYNLASPQVWQSVNGVYSKRDINVRLSTWFEGIAGDKNYLGDHGGAGWFTDQEKLFQMVKVFEQEGGQVTKFADKTTKHRRLDRLFMPFPFNWLFLPAVFQGVFTDYHIHHPAIKNIRYINQVKRFRDHGFRTRKS